MKRVIRAATSENMRKVHVPVSHGPGMKYMINVEQDLDHGFFAGQLVKIAPYDDADYVWAKVDWNGLVKFIKNGKVIDKSQLWSYEEDDYESVDEYFDDAIDQLILDLEEYNSKIKPRMIHN